MTTRICRNCGATFDAPPRRGLPKLWCSAYCKRRRGKAFADGSPIKPRPTFTPSPLNLATSAAYDACLAAGTHRAGSGETCLPRQWGVDYVPLAVCDTCGVPVTGRYLVFSLRGSSAFNEKDLDAA